MSKQQTKKSLKKFDDPIEYTDKTWHEAEKILHIALRKKALAYKFEYPNSHTEKCIIYLKKDGKVTSYMEHTAYGSWDNCTEKTPWTDQLADEIKDGYILDANVMDIIRDNPFNFDDIHNIAVLEFMNRGRDVELLTVTRNPYDDELTDYSIEYAEGSDTKFVTESAEKYIDHILKSDGLPDQINTLAENIARHREILKGIREPKK